MFSFYFVLYLRFDFGPKRKKKKKNVNRMSEENIIKGECRLNNNSATEKLNYQKSVQLIWKLEQAKLFFSALGVNTFSPGVCDFIFRLVNE